MAQISNFTSRRQDQSDPLYNTHEEFLTGSKAFVREEANVGNQMRTISNLIMGFYQSGGPWRHEVTYEFKTN